MQSRRKFISHLIPFIAAIPLIGLAACKKQRELKKCVTTDDILGPFYREGAPFRTDLNVLNQTGTMLTISGLIYGEDCNTPITGTLDIWQADTNAEYDNDSAEYNFRGKVITDSAGNYEFTTLVPAPYLNGGQYRPSHIHFRITANKHEELITQLYFAGDPYIDSDQWASDEAAEERIINLVTDASGNKTGTFNIKLMPD